MKPTTITSEIERDKLLSRNIQLTVKDFKEYLERYNVPDDAVILTQRIEDHYFENNNWDVYLKKGEGYYERIEWNEKCKGEFKDIEQYPYLNRDNLREFTDEELKLSMEQYYSLHCITHFRDEPDNKVVFLTAHY